MKRLFAGLAAVIIAVLLYQNLELRWYREQTVRLLANRLSTSLQMSGAGHATGFGMALSLYGSEARAARLGAWSPETESALAAMADDLKLIGDRLSEEVLHPADYGEIHAVEQAVKPQLKMVGVR